MKRSILTFFSRFGALGRNGVIVICSAVRRRRMAQRLKGDAPSILANDCVGGVMLHELSQPFNTPTINLYFDSHDGFLSYVEDLAYYTQIELRECGYGEDQGRRYPIGALCGDEGHPDVKIRFLHYRTFDEAKSKWEERTRRIRFDRIAVVLHAGRIDEMTLARFAALPYEKKVVVGYAPSTYPFVYLVRSMPHFIPGQLLRYKGLGGKRYLDDFDYAAFLNEGVIRPSGQK